MELVDYTVRPGNTLFGIAQFFRTTVADILNTTIFKIRRKYMLVKL